MKAELIVERKLETMAPVIVQKLKRNEASEKQIKLKVWTMTEKVTEYLPCVKPGDPLEFFLDFVDEANVLEERYSLHANLKTKFSIQSCGRAFSGRSADKWREFSGGLWLSENDGNGNKHKFNEALQKCCRALFPRGAYEDQRDYLEETRHPGDLPP